MKNEVYQIITDRIIALLEKGCVPWQKPWNNGGAEMLPRNLISGKQYRGVNTFLLHAMNFTSPYWLSFKQCQALGGKVRRGEKATPIVFWKKLEVDDREQPSGKKIVPFLRYYSGFNTEQCEGIPADKIPAFNKPVPSVHTPIEQAVNIVDNMPKKPEIIISGDRAFYAPAFDRVTMPHPEKFRSPQEFYSTEFHELVHSTGHKSRLNRKGIDGESGEWSSFGSAPYAKEELVAEMGAAFLCGQSGIVERTIDNSAAYIANWLQRLKDDNKFVVCAAASAQRASDYILNVQHETENTEAKE